MHDQQKQEAMAQYLQLRNEIDQLVERLLAIHGSQIVCRPGCCDCCVNLSVFPVEFAVIASEQEGKGEITFDPEAKCGFLHEGLCRIYESRPIICRTHGMPIVFLDDREEDPAYVVSFCPLNFPDLDEDLEFNSENTLNIDQMNERLFAINQQYTQSQPEASSQPARIELRLLGGLPNSRSGILPD
ncbi:MAG: YkgJ family cysteine cluster protein [Sedimentisphaerales bacterium]|nr:YkgJ family cysteine cluster protein [Sedimentisphaerales bacterium]